ncbi:MAG: Ig-like domain-containing protein [bacterium]|nr:Ig-like domain-containing protein [bacterium]
MELATYTYDATKIQGHLNRDASNPVEGDLGQMFIPGGVTYLNYVDPDLIDWNGYWHIANVGYYERFGFSDDWWEINSSGYYYIENCNYAIPDRYVNTARGINIDNVQAHQSISYYWAGYPENLIVKTDEYIAGLMKYFYDSVNEPPYAKQVTVIQSGTCYDAFWDWAQGQTSRTLTPDTQQARNPQAVSGQNDAIITIEFSEAVKDVNISIDSVALTGTLSQDSKSWIGTLSVNNIQTIGSGDKHLKIEAKDLTDQKLDGNPSTIAKYNTTSSQKENYEDENGSGNSGGSDTLHQFIVGNPLKIVITPNMGHITTGQTITHTVNVTNLTSLDLTIDLNQILYGMVSGYIVSALSNNQLVLAGGQSGTATFNVTNKSAIGNIEIEIECTTTGTTQSGSTYLWTGSGHTSDHPDENYEVADTKYSTPWKIDTQSKIGILLNGWGDGIGHLISTGLINSCAVKPEDFKILGEPTRSLNDLKVLIIGSAGLSGYDGSQSFKQKLAGFVSQGGTIICFTQQNGYEFNALPGGDVSGYGWNEDISCWSNAAYINELSAIFNGQTSVNIHANADGYFTKWPDNSKILLRRTKNNMPMMLEYNYGLGKVIVSTLYSDWGYGHGQSSAQEFTLIKQLISYALNPSQALTQNLSSSEQNQGLSFAATSTKEYFPCNGMEVITLHCWNKTNEERIIRCYYHRPHSGYWSYENDVKFVAPANGEGQYSLSLQMTNTDMFYAYFYDDTTNKYLGTSYYPIYIYWPKVDTTVTIDKNQYNSGQEVDISINLINKQTNNYDANLRLYILDTFNSKIYEQSIPLNILASQTISQTIKYNLPVSIWPGQYIIKAEVYSDNSKLGEDSASFEIPGTQVTVTPQLPNILSQTQNNNIAFKISNVGIKDVSIGSLSCTMITPAGSICWKGQKDFTNLNSGADITLSQNINLEQIMYGTYKLIYECNADGRLIKSEVNLENKVIIQAEYDKTAYNIRSDLGLKVNIVNNGAFEQKDVTAVIDAPECNFKAEKIFSLNPNQNIEFPLTISLPETLASGQHQVIITLKNTTGESPSTISMFNITPADIKTELLNSEVYSSGFIRVKVRNNGGIDTSFVYQLTLYNNTNNIFSETRSLAVKAQEESVLSFGPIFGEGKYDIKETYEISSNKYNGNVLGSINLLSCSIGITAQIPDKFSYSTNLVKCSAQNNGITNLSSLIGTFKVVNNLDNELIWSQAVNIGDFEVGASTEVIYAVPIDTIINKRGTYALAFELSNAGLQLSSGEKYLDVYPYLSHIIINNTSLIYNNKYMPCKAGEIISLKGWIQTQHYKCNAEVLTGMNIKIPELNILVDTPMSKIIPNSFAIAEVETVIPETVIPGDYEIYAKTTYDLDTSWIKYGYIRILPAQLKLSTAQTNYTAGQKVEIKVQNTGGVKAITEYVVNVRNSLHEEVFTQTGESTILPGTIGILYSCDLPANLADGQYALEVVATDKETQAEFSKLTKPISLDRTVITLSPVYPTNLDSNNQLGIILSNIGDCDISTGTVSCSLVDPAGTTIWSESKTFADLQVGQGTPLDFSFPISEFKLGSYMLQYTLEYVNKTETGEKIYLSSLQITSLSLDKQEYKQRENVLLASEIYNNGQVALPVDIKAEIAALSLAKSTQIKLSPGESNKDIYTLTVPDTALSAIYDTALVCQVSDSSKIIRNTSFEITGSLLKVSLSKSEYQAGELVSIELENNGGVATDCEYTLNLCDNKGMEILSRSGTEKVLADAATQISLNIPDQLCSGWYSVSLNYQDLSKPETTQWVRAVKVSGTQASLTMLTDKQIYRKEESVTSLGTLTSAGAVLNGTTLGIKVYRASEAWTNYVNTNSIQDILVDGDYVWFLTSKGLKRYDQVNDSWKAWGVTEGIVSSMFSSSSYELGTAKMLFNDTQDVYFVGSDSYMYENEKLYQVNKATGQIASYNFPVQVNGSAVILGIRNNRLLIGIGSSGLLQFDPAAKTLTVLNYSQILTQYGAHQTIAVTFDGQAIWILTMQELYKLNDDDSLELIRDNLNIVDVNNYWHSIRIKADNDNLWIQKYANDLMTNTAKIDLYRINKTSKTMTSYNLDIPFYSSSPDFVVGDKELWFLTPLVIKFDKTTNTFESYNQLQICTLNTRVISFADDDVWVGNNRYNRPTNSWTTYTQADGLISTNINAVVANGNNVWFGANEGISRYNTTANWQDFKDEMLLAQAKQAYPDNNYVWFTTNNGLVKYSKDTGQFTKLDVNVRAFCVGDTYDWLAADKLYQIDKSTNQLTELSLGTIDPNAVTNIYQEGNYLWLLCNSSGQEWLVKYDLTTKTDEEYPGWNSGYNNSYKVVPYGDQIWVMAKDQIRKFSKIDNSLSAISWPQSLSVSGCTYDNGFLWLLTSNALVKYDMATGEILKTITYPGAAYNTGTAIDSLNGTIWININTYSGASEVAKYNESLDKWTEYSSNNGLINGQVSNIALDISYVWFIADCGVSRLKDKGSILWQKDLAVNGSGTINFNELIGQLGETGKFYVEGTATNSLGQQLAKAENNFYVTTSNVAMTLNTDKKLYKTGETITITGEVINSGMLDENSVQMNLGKESGNISSGSYSLAAGAKQTYTATTIADKSFLLTGKTICGTEENVVEEYISVVDPAVELTVTGPDTAGQDSFDLGILVKNSGQVDIVSSLQMADGSQNTDLGQITLKPGETKYISQSCQISKDTAFEIKLTGDAAQAITKEVKFGCTAAMNITPALVYPASTVTSKQIFEIPVNITNTGTVDMTLNISWQLADGGWQFSKTKEYYIPAEGGVYDNLVLEGAPAGDYVLNYTSNLVNGSVLIRVAEFNTVEVTDIQYQVSGSTITVNATVKNTGANDFVGNFAGNLKLGEAKAYESEQELTLTIDEEKTIAFDVPTINLSAGTYLIGAVVLHNGFEIATRNTDIVLQADYSLTSFDDNQIFNAGSPATIKATIKNTGPVEGQAEVQLASGDIVNYSQSAWLKSGEEKELTFTFVPADDLEEKTYVGYITVGGQAQMADGSLEQIIHFTVNGYKINVNSSFDKLAYTEGEIAHLTLTLSNDGSLEAPIFTKVNFNDYQVTTATITVTKGIPVIQTFDVPVHHTGAKLFYGVYHESGRSLNLNTLYVYKQEESISFIADKQQYQAGENMTLTLLLNETGVLNLDAPGYQSDVNIVSVDTQTITFALPVDIVTGTHYVNYTFTPSSGTIQQGQVPIDIVGYTIKVVETTLDQNIYYPNQTIKFKTRIDSNKDVADTQLKIWLKSSDKVVEWYSDTVNVAVGQNTLTCEGTMTLADQGIGQIIFGLYKGELLLSSGQKAFDVDIYDSGAPVTIIQRTADGSWQTADKTYITEKTQIYFSAIDTGTKPSGIDFTEYAIDASTWTIYASSFTLTGEGEHTIKYRSRDKAGNLEDTKQAVYYLDTTAPESLLKIPDISFQLPDGSTYFVSPATFTITANDTLAGVDYVEYVVDNSTPIKAGYQIPFEIIGNFADGSHNINYFSVDKLGNKEAEKTLTFLIDSNAPETKLQIADGSWQTADKTYINANSKIELTTIDTGAGIDHINYRVDAGTTTVYTEPFNLGPEGMHTICYSAIDQLGTMEKEKSCVLHVDTTTPVSNFKITDASYAVTEGPTTYVNSHSTFTISAIDPLSNGVSSGIKNIRYQMADGGWQIAVSSYQAVNLTGISDGQHEITYLSTDNVENTEAERTYNAIFDGTKPQVKSTYPANNAKVKAKKATPITITFSEPVQSIDWNKSIEIKESGKVVEWNSNKGFNITYDTTTYTVNIDGKLKNNKVYEVILKNTISDRVKNYLDASQFSFQTMMSAAEGGTIIDPATGLTVIVPPHCLPCDGYFEIALVDQINPPKLPKPLKWLNNGQKAYQIIFYNENSIIVQQPVKKFFQVLLALNQQWITTTLETNPVEYKNIKLYQTGSVLDFVARTTQKAAASSSLEKNQHAPRLLSEQKFNAQDQELTIEMDSFGIFALAGFNAPDTSLDDLSCYPNPFNPCKQNITIQYYLLNESEVTIAIYDLLGNLVKTWEIPTGDMNARTGLNQLSWDGRNGQGDTVANGGYILFVHSDGQKKKFKILVVK